MVRVNLVPPKSLSDQHLVAEYDEILMLCAYIKKYPQIDKDKIPKKFILKKGHMIFFKNKVLYLKKRHDLLKMEMKKRGFKSTKTIRLSEFQKQNKKDWKPKKSDLIIITERISYKLRLKPNYYRYYGEYRATYFFLGLLHKKD